jgi:polar amino acid transport system substrate-binding protein
MTKTNWYRRARIAAGTVVCSLSVVACGSSSAGSSSSSSTPASSTAGSAGAKALDPAAAALLPSSIKSSGVIRDGVNAAFAPFEDVSSSGKIVGLDIDLAQAIARALGVKLQIENTGFPNLVPGVQSGRYDMSESGLTDDRVREAAVGFTDYARDGTSLLVPKGNSNNLTLSTVCGKMIAVVAASSQAQIAVPQLDKACSSAGKPSLKLLTLPQSSDPVVALSSGRAEGAIVDTVSAVTAVRAAPDKLQLAPGKEIDSSVLGIAIAKDGPLLGATEKAIDFLISDGTYAKVFKKWGLPQIMVTRAQINGGATTGG